MYGRPATRLVSLAKVVLSLLESAHMKLHFEETVRRLILIETSMLE